MISVEVLGTGGAFDAFSTSYLVNGTVLVDCGMETTKELIHSGRAFGLTDLYITHLHQDHVAGLEALIFYLRGIPRDKKSGIRLRIHAGPDFMDYYNQLKCSRDYAGNFVREFELPEPSSMRVINAPVEGDPDVRRNLYINMLPNVHCGGSIASYAIRFRETFSHHNTRHLQKVNTLFISGDTDEPIDFLKYDIDIKDKNTLVFHDMGWSGVENTEHAKVHPTEDEVYRKYGPQENLIGIHMSASYRSASYRSASYKYRYASKNEVFFVGAP